MSKKINIAIDGYSSCGKSTLAKTMAAQLGYVFVDTGAMYRAVTYFAISNDLFEEKVLDEKALIARLDDLQIRFRFNAEKGFSETYLNGENVEEEIRKMPVSRRVSIVAAVKEVREKLVAQQREMGIDKGVVMDGRDIGTVVFPDAELKLFMTANMEVRTQRRYAELSAKGHDISLEEVEKNIKERDYIDTHRATDPLRQAEDAVVIDNSELTPDQQLNIALELVEERLEPCKL